MTNLGPWVLAHDRARALAELGVRSAPEGYVVIIREPNRTLEQNSALHRLLACIVKSKTKWAGQEWDIDSWRAIFASAFAKADNLPCQTIPGLEGEFVAIRRSTARMTKKELSGMIEYVQAWCAQNGVPTDD